MENLREYVKEKVECGSIWLFEVEDNNSNIFMACNPDRAIDVNLRGIEHKINVEDFIVLSPEEIYCCKKENFDILFKRTNKNDYYQCINAKKYLNSKLTAEDIFKKSKHNNISHLKESSLFEKLSNSLSEDFDAYFLPEDNTNENIISIISARNNGEGIDYNALTDYAAKHIPEELEELKIPYIIIETLFEQKINEEQEFDIDAILQNNKDNLLITMERDQEIIRELLGKMMIHEVSEKSLSIDGLSLEELLILKDQVLSLVGAGAKMGSLIASLDKIEAQIEQERTEKEDLYGRDDPVLDRYPYDNKAEKDISDDYDEPELTLF